MNYRIFKNREYDSTIGDTILLLRTHGGKFFKFFLIVNTLIMIIQTLVLYSFPFNIVELFDEPENVILYIVIFVPLFMILVMYIATFFQFILHDKMKEFNVSTILHVYKQVGLKALYILPLLFLWTIVYIIICTLLSITIIGIPVVIIILPSYFIWMLFSINDYFFGETPLGKCFGKNFKRVKKEFWHNTGTTIVIMIVSTIVGTVFSFIPAIISILNELVSQSNLNITNFLTDYQSSFLGSLSSTIRIDFVIIIQFIAFSIMYYRICYEEVEIDLAIEQIGKK